MKLIDRYNLKIRKKTRKPRTPDSTQGMPVFPNLMYSFIPSRINQLWVNDINYIPVWINENEYAICYLSLITNAYNHEIVGWQVGNSLATKYSSEALKMAFSRLKGADEHTADRSLIPHSGRGIQYASNDYVFLLKERGINISMTESGNPKDNAIAERINLTIKEVLLKDLRFKSISEIRAAIAKAVEFYNNERPHMSLDMMTPSQAAKFNGELKKWWHSYRDEAIKNASA